MTTNPFAALFALFGIDLDEVRPALRRFRFKRKRDPLRYLKHTARRRARRPMTEAIVTRWREAMLTVAKDLARRKAEEREARPLTRARRNKLDSRWVGSRGQLAPRGRRVSFVTPSAELARFTWQDVTALASKIAEHFPPPRIWIPGHYPAVVYLRPGSL